MIKLVPITDVKASEYNPRKNDEKRLALTEMSLRKLGFLLPIYADTSGEILSGHQRHLVATRMGFTILDLDFNSQQRLAYEDAGDFDKEKADEPVADDTVNVFDAEFKEVEPENKDAAIIEEMGLEEA